jgi:hypothetical protein
MIVPLASSWVSAITWKRVIIAAIIVSLASYAITLKIEGLRYQKDLKTLEAAKLEALDNKEAELKGLIANYQDSISTRDFNISVLDTRIDSFGNALTLKDIQLDKIHDDVQTLVGDSLGIADELNSIFAKR